MYSNPHAAMPPPQARSVAPETFLLDQEAQNSLPPESIVALQQVDNRKLPRLRTTDCSAAKLWRCQSLPRWLLMIIDLG